LSPIAAAVVDRMNGGYAQSSEPLVTMMDMLLVPDESVMDDAPQDVRWISRQISRDVFISKVE
jgi:hypothetical protein